MFFEMPRMSENSILNGAARAASGRTHSSVDTKLQTGRKRSPLLTPTTEALVWPIPARPRPHCGCHLRRRRTAPRQPGLVERTGFADTIVLGLGGQAGPHSTNGYEANQSAATAATPYLFRREISRTARSAGGLPRNGHRYDHSPRDPWLENASEGHKRPLATRSTPVRVCRLTADEARQHSRQPRTAMLVREMAPLRSRRAHDDDGRQSVIRTRVTTMTTCVPGLVKAGPVTTSSARH